MRSKRIWLVAMCGLLLGLILGPRMHHHHHHPRGPHHSPLTITSIQGRLLTLVNSQGWSKSVLLSSETRIHRGPDGILEPTDLRVGQNIHERDRWSSSLYVAEDIDVIPQIHADGEIVGVSAQRLLLRDRSGFIYSAEAAAGAHVHSGRLAVNLSQVQAGEHVILDGDLRTDGIISAENVDFPEFYRLSHWALGLCLLAGLGGLAARKLRARQSQVYQPGLYD